MIIKYNNDNYIYIINKNNNHLDSIPQYYKSFFLKGCNFVFKGKGNILIITDITHFSNTHIFFSGDRSIIIIGDSLVQNITLDIYNDSTLFIGHNNFFNPAGEKKRIIVGESQNFILGNDNLISVSLWIRTTCAHLIYDLNGKRTNLAGSVIIGDHVWFGESISILGPISIGSGAIIGANSFLHKKEILSNSVWAGEPAKQINLGRCWLRTPTNYFTKDQIDEYNTHNVDSVIFNKSSKSINHKELDGFLKSNSVTVRADYLITLLYNIEKNRFSL